MADDILKNIPLPADLPENWTSQQTVAPTGAEVGMDEQYGYNYLMKQVNNAQKALKALAAQREEDLARIKIFVSDDPTSPASFIGGTWERIEGKFVMGASDTYPAGSTGGSATHTQTENEVGSHEHTISTPNYGQILYGGSGVSEGISGRALVSYNTGNNAADATPFIARKSDVAPNPMNILNPYYSMYIWRRVA